MKSLKALLAVTLLFAFLGSVLGVQIHKHYCGDFLQDISIYIQSNPCADEGGEDACSKGKKTSCCNDETEFYQLEIDLIKHSVDQEILKFSALQEFILYTAFWPKEEVNKEAAIPDEPPPISSVPIYKKLQRLTFYG